jgi:integrase
MSKVEPLRNLEGKKEMLFWTPEEFKAFIAAVSPKFKTFFNFLYVTGCRKGEALALTVSDIDFGACRATIYKSVTNKTTKGAYTVTTPKNNASVRSVELPEWLVAAIKEEAPKKGYLFGGERPYSTTHLDRVFAEGIAKSGVKRIRIHDLRHSCASLLISQGVPIVAVSRRLGHSDIEQTLNTYSHMLPKDEKRIVSVFSAL